MSTDHARTLAFFDQLLPALRAGCPRALNLARQRFASVALEPRTPIEYVASMTSVAASGYDPLQLRLFTARYLTTAPGSMLIPLVTDAIAAGEAYLDKEA